MTDIAGSRCVVTGGARGMGRLLGERFLARGARVVLVDRDGEALEGTSRDLSGLGDVRAVVADLSDGGEVYRAAERCLELLGGVDVLVNNAGVVTGGPLTEVSEERHTLTFAVNALAVVRMTRAVLPSMIAAGRGHVVNMGSAAGLTGVALQTTYSASKWAVVGFSEALHYELQHLGHAIAVTCICPGYVDTGMFDGVRPPRLVPMLRPEDVVDRTLEAIQRNERLVAMPLVVRQLPWMRALLPERVLDFLSDRLGANRSMEGWRGRPQP